MMRTRLYLDVDNVINAQMPMGWGRLAHGYARFGRYSFRIRWAPAMVAALAELDLDIMWATTWRDDAPRSIAPLIGLGLAGRVIHPNSDRNAETTLPSIDWKFPAVVSDQEKSPSPFIWADDELEDHMIEWAASAGGLAIRPNPRLGLTPKQIEAMRNYCAAVDGALV